MKRLAISNLRVEFESEIGDDSRAQQRLAADLQPCSEHCCRSTRRLIDGHNNTVRAADNTFIVPRLVVGECALGLRYEATRKWSRGRTASWSSSRSLSALSIERTDCITDVGAFASCTADGEDGCCPQDRIEQLRNEFGLAEESKECLFGMSSWFQTIESAPNAIHCGVDCGLSRSVQPASSMLSVARSSTNVFLISFSFCFIFEAFTMSTAKTLVFARPNHLIMSLPTPSSVYVVLSLSSIISL